MLWIFPCEVFVYKHFFFYYVFTINCSLGEKFPISVRRRSAPLFRFGLFFHLHPEMPVTFMCLYASAFNLFLLTERWIHSWNVVFLNRNLRPMLAAFTHDHAAVSTHEVKPQRRQAELRELGLPRLTGNDPCVSRGQGTKGSGDKTELLRDWGSSPRSREVGPERLAPHPAPACRLRIWLRRPELCVLPFWGLGIPPTWQHVRKSLLSSSSSAAFTRMNAVFVKLLSCVREKIIYFIFLYICLEAQFSQMMGYLFSQMLNKVSQARWLKRTQIHSFSPRVRSWVKVSLGGPCFFSRFRQKTLLLEVSACSRLHSANGHTTSIWSIFTWPSPLFLCISCVSYKVTCHCI